eukprot:PhM_4_TR14885/c0_g1_i1/m.106585
MDRQFDLSNSKSSTEQEDEAFLKSVLCEHLRTLGPAIGTKKSIYKSSSKEEVGDVSNNDDDDEANNLFELEQIREQLQISLHEVRLALDQHHHHVDHLQPKCDDELHDGSATEMETEDETIALSLMKLYQNLETVRPCVERIHNSAQLSDNTDSNNNNVEEIVTQVDDNNMAHNPDHHDDGKSRINTNNVDDEVFLYFERMSALCRRVCHAIEMLKSLETDVEKVQNETHSVSTTSLELQRRAHVLRECCEMVKTN